MMYDVKIAWPSECDTVVKKKEYLQQILDWGDGAIVDQDRWDKFRQMVNSDKVIVFLNHREISFVFKNEIDAMAIRMAWSDG